MATTTADVGSVSQEELDKVKELLNGSRAENAALTSELLALRAEMDREVQQTKEKTFKEPIKEKSRRRNHQILSPPSEFPFPDDPLETYQAVGSSWETMKTATSTAS